MPLTTTQQANFDRYLAGMHLQPGLATVRGICMGCGNEATIPPQWRITICRTCHVYKRND